MTCFIAKNLLSELVDDELPVARRSELESHLADCTGCSLTFTAGFPKPDDSTAASD